MQSYFVFLCIACELSIIELFPANSIKYEGE